MTDVLSNIQTVSIKITTRENKIFDISQFFAVINIYQSLFNKKFINARIILTDTNDFLTNLPIIGGEDIRISIQNSIDSNVIDYNFKIYKVDRDINTLTTSQKVKILNIYLYTQEEFNNYTKISKRFSGNGNSIISTLLTDNLQTEKTCTQETDNSSIDFISNYWTVDKCIDYVCNHTKSTYFDFIFYETNEGYNFNSLSNLFEQPSVSTLKIELEKEQFTNINNILRFQNNSYFDDLLWRKRGLFGSTSYKLDFDNYSFDYEQQTIIDIDENINHSGSNRLYNSNIDTDNNIFVTYNDVDINLTRTTHLNFLNRYNFVVNLNGSLDRNVGDIFTINFPSLDNESASGSDSFSGKWIAIEINTTIYQNNDLKQNISFAKNSLFNNYRLEKY